MALYHKWDVNNGFAYLLTFFSLISDGLGGVIGMMPMVMVLLAMEPLVMVPLVMVPFVTVPLTMVANDDLLKVPENNGAFGDSPFRGQSHRQRLQPFMTVAAP